MELSPDSTEAGLMVMVGKKPTPIIKDANALLLRGIDALERNHLEEAVGLLQQSVDIDPESFYAQLALGIALTKALEIPRAELALETAIRIDPKNFYGRLRMAEFFQRIGVPDRAKQELQLALDLARTIQEKKAARDLLDAETRKDRQRAWRPNFTKLIRRRSKE